MRPEHCVYELIEVRLNKDLLSKKGDEIVFNPAYNAMLARFLKNKTLRLHNLTDVCNACGLCTPTIVQTEVGFRISRANYQPNQQEVRKPMYEITHFSPDKSTTKRNIRITVVDDGQPQSVAKWLSNYGYFATAIWVNPNWDATPKAHQLLIQAIEQTRPNIVICDKGLGFFDGIEILKVIQNQGPRTIMHTGEFDTRETHLVADAFVEKTGVTNKLLETVRSLE